MQQQAAPATQSANHLDVSVVIPCFEQADLLDRAIESLLAGSRVPAQIVVIDDGSREPVTSRFSDRPEVAIHRQANAGLAAARNAGLAQCRCGQVLFLDADDWMEGSGLADLAAIGAGAGVVIGAYREVFSDGTPAKDVFPYPGDVPRRLAFGNLGPPHIFLWPTDVVRALDGFRPIIGGHEDYDLVCRAAAAGQRFVSVHRVVANYWKAPGSMSTKVALMDASRAEVWAAYAQQWLANDQVTADQMVELVAGALALPAASWRDDRVQSAVRALVARLGDTNQSVDAAQALVGIHSMLVLAVQAQTAPRAQDPGAAERYLQQAIEWLATLPIAERLDVRPAVFAVFQQALLLPAASARRVIRACQVAAGVGDFHRVQRLALVLARRPIPRTLRPILLQAVRTAAVARRNQDSRVGSDH